MKTVEFRRLTEDLTRIFAEERAHLAALVDAELSRLHTAVSSALLASEGTDTEDTEAFADEVSVSTSGIAAGASSSHISYGLS